MTRLIALLGGWPLVLVAATVPEAPTVFVDGGACPFECCTYGAWRAAARVPAYQRPVPDAPSVLWVAKGASLEALGGFVRTHGQRFHVHREHGAYRPGDVLMVYTYLGEGSFRVWHAGRWTEQDLGFSPYGGGAGTRCTGETCWGTLEAAVESEWWVWVRLPAGRTLWVRGDAGFQGQDACG